MSLKIVQDICIKNTQNVFNNVSRYLQTFSQFCFAIFNYVADFVSRPAQIFLKICQNCFEGGRYVMYES